MINQKKNIYCLNGEVTIGAIATAARDALIVSSLKLDEDKENQKIILTIVVVKNKTNYKGICYLCLILMIFSCNN